MRYYQVECVDSLPGTAITQSRSAKIVGSLRRLSGYYLEPSLAIALKFVGISHIHVIAIVGQEAGGEALAKSVAEATRKVERLVDELQVTWRDTQISEPA